MMERLKEEIDVWQWDLDLPHWDRFTGGLSEAEKTKAGQFYHERDQHRYRRCRAVVREILARYVPYAAGQLSFVLGKFGKPTLAQSRLQFNLSHANHRAVLVVSDQVVGVDIESEQVELDLDAMAELVCHPQEYEQLNSCVDEDRLASFIKLWTQKEAYCKVLGLGLQKNLIPIQMVIAGDGVVQVEDEALKHHAAFFMHDILPPPNFAISLCTPYKQPGICKQSTLSLLY